ncbi:MAG TPA: molybdopterin cofactor-binding domain-containing protein, partial [Candidatus Bathyarchaeia archaeon]|nr:molybdopterin cofactor-binding domain-containing protein [Candidatus Bathyarchaeia archaeon]
NELSVVGKRIPMLRWFASEKVTGKAKFTVDMKLPGMLHAKMVRSPYPHARILKVDTSKAEKLPGVKAILSKNNMRRIRRGQILDDWYLFDEKVRLVGETVAAVVAVSDEVAEEAAELVEVEYEKLPAVFDAEEAIKDGAPQIQSVKNNIATYVAVEVGDVEKGFKEADLVFEDRYSTQAMVPSQMEPKAALCSFDPASGKLTVWNASQAPFTDRAFLALSLGLPVSKVNVIGVPHVGGHFGGRNPSQVEVTCAAISMHMGLPVKYEITREEEFCEGFTRHPSVGYLKTGVKKDGTLTARKSEFIINTGPYADMGPSVVRCVGEKWTWLYGRCPNIKYEGKLVYTNTPIASGMRGWGEPQGMFACESQMDRIAEELGMDPLELRMKNAVQAGDVNLKLLGMSIGSCGLEECMKKGSEKICWENRQKRPGAVGDTKKCGIGMGLGVHVSGAWPFVPQRASAFLKLNEDGTVNWLAGANDIGMGRFTAFAQIIAEELGIRFEDVNVIPCDTDTAPLDRGSGATGGTHVQGMAMKLAAADLKKQIIEKAARMLNASPEGMEIRDRRVCVKGIPERGVTVAEVAQAAASFPEPQVMIGKSTYAPPGNAPPFAANFAEVEVDTETGKVKVLRLVSAIDIGRAINPLSLEGQIQGGVQMGLGYALTEQVLVSEKTGAVQNPGFMDYKVFTSPDMPELIPIIVESQELTGPFHAKGVGECPVAPTAPAIANAIYNATGARVKDLPITPERVLKALQERSNA